MACGITVTDPKAALLPISSRYLGTRCTAALATITNGGGMIGWDITPAATASVVAARLQNRAIRIEY